MGYDWGRVVTMQSDVFNNIGEVGPPIDDSPGRHRQLCGRAEQGPDARTNFRRPRRGQARWLDLQDGQVRAGFYFAYSRDAGDALRRESPIPLAEMHLGGGTPTFLSPAELGRMIGDILKDVRRTADSELSIKPGQRHFTEEDLPRGDDKRALYELGRALAARHGRGDRGGRAR